MRVNPGQPITANQFLDVSADETYGQWIDVRGCTAVTFYVLGKGTTSSGVITFEETAPKDFSVFPFLPSAPVDVGNYPSITTLNASVVSAGLQQAVHLQIAAYAFVRARISTAIGGGGTISCGVVAY
jgi:hypothetical protein